MIVRGGCLPRARRARRPGYRRGCLALCLLLFTATARAEVAVARYAVDLTLPEEGPARCQLLLAYAARGEVKAAGFKYLGKERPEGLTVTDVNGEPLRFDLRSEPGSEEYRVDYALPPPDAERQQPVLIEFTQRLPQRHGLLASTLEVPWAHRFRIPVMEMRVTVNRARLDELPGFRCVDGGRGRTCVRVARELAPIEITLPPSRSGAVPAAAIFAACAAAVAIHLVRRRRSLLTERGVLLPATGAIAPTGGAYQGPPPLPQTAEPVLSAEDRRAFGGEVAAALGMVLGPTLAAAILLGLLPLAPLPALWLLAGTAALCTAVLVLGAGRRGEILAMSLPVAAVAVTGFLWVLLVFAGALAFVYFVRWVAKQGGGGGSGGSWSGGISYDTSSGGSSCGGGGGGCGGGGGGGGCGG